MKKLTLAFAIIVMGLVMVSCGNTAKKENIMKAIDAFFAKAEEKVQTIENGENFLAYLQQFKNDKEQFFQNTFAEYKDEEGNIKVFSEDEWDEIQNYITNRATTYDKVEVTKATEILMPLIEEYENAVNAMCENYNPEDDETFGKLMFDLDKSENALNLFADYDKMPTDLQQRIQTAEAKLHEFVEKVTASEE